MAVALTKMSVLREAVGVEDLVFMIFDMDVKSNHSDMLVMLRSYLVNMRSGVGKLMTNSVTYFSLAKFYAVPSDEELELVELSRKRNNKVVMDLVRDIPYIARSSRSAAEFRMRLLEHYGRSVFLCGIANTYMCDAMYALLPPVEHEE